MNFKDNLTISEDATKKKIPKFPSWGSVLSTQAHCQYLQFHFQNWKNYLGKAVVTFQINLQCLF